MLQDINSPKDIKNLSVSELKSLSSEIREFLIESVTKTGGHLASNLGVVELTVALHYVFDFDSDRLIWDVGHQAYVHKMLTGRLNEFDTLRKFGGISGFPKRNESKFDTFNVGHASTSASAAMGMARARDLSGEKYEIVSVFGDGALTGGMIFEALNDAGHSDSKVIFILNDNDMSISPNVGAISRYLQKLRQKPEYYKSKDYIEALLSKLPLGSDVATKTAKKAKQMLRQKVIPTTLFDNLGLNYVGPVDGHNIDALIDILKIAKKSDKSVFIHIRTTKGKGYAPAEKYPQLYHSVSALKAHSDDYSKAFGRAVLDIAERNKKVVAITGAMPINTGLETFSKKFKDRYFDVGIAEEHAVTMAAGLAAGGYIPVVPIYSTFFQRAYDQILHDVCLQNLHIVLCFDHAGVVGADGETHQGMYDIAYLSHMPNMTILSPSSFAELSQMLDYAVNSHNGPIAIRYPKGNTEFEAKSFEFGKVQKLCDGKKLLIVTTGRMLTTAKTVAEHFNAELLAVPTIKPLDKDAILAECKGKKLVVTIEDGTAIGGLGSIIGTLLAESASSVSLLVCGYPDVPIIHGSVKELDKLYEMDANSIIKKTEEKLVCLKKKELIFF